MLFVTGARFIVIEVMQKEDLSAVMGIWLAGNLQAHSFFPDGYWQGFYKDVENQMEQAEVYVYKTEGTICGFLGLKKNYLAGLFVAQCQQGKGIGKALIQYVQQKKNMLLLHVYAENERAVMFYQKQGFSITVQQKQDGHLEYEMQWHLNR